MFQIVSNDINIDFVGKQKPFLLLSGLVILASLLAVIFIGPTYGIDFKGGTNMVLHFEEDVTAEQVRDAATEAGLVEPSVQRFGDEEENRFLVETRSVSVIDADVVEGLQQQLGTLATIEELEWSEEQPNFAEVTFASPVEVAAIETAIAEAGIENTTVRQVGVEEANRYELRFEGLQQYVERQLSALLGDAFNPDTGVARLETVGARVGEQFRNAGILSILVALLFILIYIAFRFDIRYAPGAVAALTHDVIIAVGFFTVAGIEISLPIVAALLTIVGYSLNDTIVVFDRIRENLEAAGSKTIDAIANRSLNETLSRTLITSLTTLLAVAAIAVLGGGLIQDFAVALIVGVVIGTYSSLFIATPIMLMMDRFLEARREADEILETQKAKTPV